MQYLIFHWQVLHKCVDVLETLIQGIEIPQYPSVTFSFTFSDFFFYSMILMCMLRPLLFCFHPFCIFVWHGNRKTHE